MRCTVTVLIAVGVALAVGRMAGAEEVKAPITVGTGSRPVYSAAVQPPGRRVDSVLTDPRDALTSTKGTGWLLHSGKKHHDTCERADVTFGLRMVCVGW